MLLFISGLCLTHGLRAEGQEKSAKNGITPEEAAVAAEMRTRVFKAPDFVEYPQAADAAQREAIALEALRNLGIPFPKGAGAFYNQDTGHLIVTNTLENLGEVQRIVGNVSPSVATVACSVTVIEGPGELIRQAQAASVEKVDATASLATLLGYARNAGAKVRVVGDCWVESLSGTPAKAEAVCEYAFPQPLKLDARSRVAQVPWETRQVGLRLEIETEVGADRQRLDSTLNLKLHPALPSVRQTRVSEPLSGQAAEFPVAELGEVGFKSSFSLVTGTTRLIGIAKPTSVGNGEDTLWAAFATFTVRLPANANRLLEPALVTPAATAPQPPQGMRTVLFAVPQELVDPWRRDARPDQPAPPLRDWLVEKGIVFPPGAGVEHGNDVLRMTNTPENIGRLVALLEPTLASTYRTTAFTLHTYQAPAAFLRELAHRTTATVDDAAMLAAVEQAVARGEATCIDSIFLETKRDETGIHEAGYEHSYVSKFSSDAKGRPALELGRRHVGSLFSAEVTQQDHATSTFAYKHELHNAPPAQRRVRFQDPATQKAFALPVTDFHVARTHGSLCLTSGTTRLLALHEPVGKAAGGPALLCATFLRADAVPQACRFTHEAIAAIEEKRAKAAAKLREDPQAWETRTFRVPPGYSFSGDLASNPGPSPQQVFEAQGVKFPEGAVVSLNRKTSTVFLKNTRENMAIAEAFVNDILSFTPSTLVISAQVLEGPGPLLRQLVAQACGKNDHRVELEAVLAAVKAGTMRHVDTLHCETKSGSRLTSGSRVAQSYLAGVTTDGKGVTVFEEGTHEGGFRLELEPTVGADGYVAWIGLAADFATAPPTEHRETLIDTRGLPLEFPLTDHHRAKITTLTTIPHHHARLIHLWKPTGKPEPANEDVLQVLFITCDIMRDGGVE